MLAHELLSLCNPDHEMYAKLKTSLKFDLGDFDELEPIAEMGRLEFYETPAPTCLYQVTWFDETFLVLSEQQECGGAVWQPFVKSQGRWVDVDVELYKGPNAPPKQDETVMISARKHSGNILWGAYGAINKDSPWDGLSDLERNALVVSMFMAKAVEVFSCSNVKRLEHRPTEKQNLKRIKKGKAPKFSFWTLHIDLSEKEKSEAVRQGSHASPRLHIRRGHIRRLADGRRIWVRAAMVGDKSRGMVMKDYRVA